MAFPSRAAVSSGADEIMAMILSTASPASGETSIPAVRASARKSWSCASAAKPAYSAVNRSGAMPGGAMSGRAKVFCVR